MRVILLEDVKKQGKKGQIISVKDGYGNYLITNHLAVLETKGSIAFLNKQIEEAKENEKQILKKSQEIKQKLEQLILEFKVKVGAKDQVFGSISSKQIADYLKEKGIEIDKRKIKISTPINTLGITKVKIELHKDVIAEVKVHLLKGK